MSYAVIKLIHILAVIIWLGPATGAFWLLLRVGRGSNLTTTLALETAFEQILRLEHIALFCLIASGIWLFAGYNFNLEEAPWLAKKLVLFGIVLIIEIFDILLSHLLFHRARQQLANGDLAAWENFVLLRKKFYWITIPILLLLLPTILALAVIRF